MKPNFFFCCCVISLHFCGCSKQSVTDDKSQNLVTLPIENSDLRIEPIYNSNVSCTGVRALTFVDESKGIYISPYGFVYATTNKGLRWDVVLMSPHVDTVVTISDVKVIDKQILIAFGYKTENKDKSINIIVKSTNWGQTWQTVYTSTESNIEVAAVDEKNNLYTLKSILSANGTIKTVVLKSIDLGATWQSVSTLDFGDAQSITYASKKRLLLKSPSKGEFISTDGGETWARSIDFIYNSTGHDFGKGFGFSQTEIKAEIFKTDDAISSWSKIYSTYTTLKNMKVVSDKAVFIFGELPYTSNQEKARLIYTLDEGNTWKEMAFLKNDYARIAFYDAKNGYIVTNNGFCFFKITLK